MEPITKDVWQLTGWPRHYFNVYLLHDVLIDTGTRWAASRLRRQLVSRRPRSIALTHVHPDHQGSAHALCNQYDIPLACHEADVAAMEGHAPMQPANRLLTLGDKIWSGPPHTVARVLREGDDLAGFRVLHTPGHTPGHVIYFRESDRVVIAGDLLANINFVTGDPGLREPPPFFSHDPAQNRRSLQRLFELEPKLICFGHGPPLREPHRLVRFAARVAQSAAKRLQQNELRTQ